MDAKQIGDKIKWMRESRGLTQENMAIDLGMSTTSYCELEGGKHKIDAVVLTKIARLLGVDVAIFLQPGPMVLNIQDNHHNSNVGYNHVENQHMVPKDVLDRLLTAHERLIDVFEKAFGRAGGSRPEQ